MSHSRSIGGGSTASYYQPRQAERTFAPPAPRTYAPVDTYRGARAERNAYSNGNTYVAPSGQVFHPNNSTIVDQHLSRNGNVVTTRQDGIRQVRDQEGRLITQGRIPVYQTRPAPLGAPVRAYTPRQVNITNVTINQHNTYIRDTGSYYSSRPVFYSGYAWTPPSFTAVVLTAGLTMAAIDLAYAASYPRYPITAWSAPPLWASSFPRYGINSSYDLVSRGRTQSDREMLALQTGMPYTEVRKAVGQADLMRVAGVGPEYSRYLVDAGVNSVQDLARCYEFGPEALIEQMRYSPNYQGGPLPSPYEVERWMQQAMAMPVAVYDDDHAPRVP
jgi:hypothetical protein